MTPSLAALPARAETCVPNAIGLRLNDLELRGRALVIRKTDATVRFDWALVREIGRGLRIVLLLLMVRRWWLRATHEERPHLRARQTIPNRGTWSMPRSAMVAWR